LVPDRIERVALNSVDLDLSTLADLVGAAAAVLTPLHELIRQHVLGAERLHGDTTVPVLALSALLTTPWDRAKLDGQDGLNRSGFARGSRR
jgi:hypothetical protein